MTENKKVAVLGGSFNPPTLGHLDVARSVLKHTDMNEVWLMPCNQTPYSKELAPGLVRCQMVDKMCEKEDNIVSSWWEIQNNMRGKTYETISLLKSQFPEIEFYFIIGADNADRVIDEWFQGKKLVNENNFIVVPRSGYYPIKRWFRTKPHIYLLEHIAKSFSSTKVREMIVAGENLDGEVHPSVIKFIEKTDLYKLTTKTHKKKKNKSDSENFRT